MSKSIQKLKNYNQILLALAGTILLIFVIISGIIFISEIWPRSFEEDGMMANSEVESLANQNSRKEIISFSEPELIDSIDRLFVIPVITTDLDNLESLDKSLGLMNKFTGGSEDDLATNNLILYNEKSNSSIIVFERRLRISNYKLKDISEEKIILIKGCEVDSNQDKYLNSKDLQRPYFYNISKDTVQTVNFPLNYSFLDLYNSYYDAHNIYRFGVDKNSDGFFDRSNEPTVLMKLDLQHNTMKQILTKNQIDKLQETLNGI